jgi:hypothetical protein
MPGPRFVAAASAPDRPSFVTRQIAGETLIVPVAGNVADLESVYVLNEVGSRVWELLRTPVAVDEIVTTVVDEFAVDPARAREDLVAFLDALVSRGLVRHAP